MLWVIAASAAGPGRLSPVLFTGAIIIYRGRHSSWKCCGILLFQFVTLILCNGVFMVIYCVK